MPDSPAPTNDPSHIESETQPETELPHHAAATPKVVVITGASAGLGRAVAHAFAKTGAKLALLARNPEALHAAVAECHTLGSPHALAIPTDVSDPDAVEAAATEAEQHLGPIDIWVNNAMVSVFSPVKQMTAADYRRVTDVTYLGYVHGTLSAYNRFLTRNRGTVVQVGSALAYRSIPLQSAYCAAKHAINGFTDSLRCELSHDSSDIKITTVQMPAMNTIQFNWVKNRLPNDPQPVPPIFEPEIAAKVVLAAGLSKHPRREYWLGTPTVEAIVGQKFIPGLLDRYLGKTGYKSQQLEDQPRDPDALNNLYQYVPGVHSARGKFDKRSKRTSAEVFLTLHRHWVLLGATLALAAGATALTRRSK